MKKFLSHAGWLILFLAVLVVLYKGFDYLISDDTESQTRVSFHDYYKEDKIDYLFIGPSHTNHEINAVRLSQELDQNVFNLSTSSQDFIGAYYLVREAIKEKNGATTRCMPFVQAKHSDVCVHCGKPAKAEVYFGKAY